MNRKFGFVVLMVFCSAIFVQNVKAAQIPVIEGDYMKLMEKAVKEGKASAYLSGQVADYIREQIKHPEAKILLEITRVDNHGKPGCHGLRMKFSTPGTLLPMTDGSSRELDLGHFTNLCPKSSSPP
ncbi:MAG: hypothetical protein LBP99_03870 [Azoarcus sp.]|jgi:hypothetical protein|nr:hypothetical protein [Azoarcus sp.]